MFNFTSLSHSKIEKNLKHLSSLSDELKKDFIHTINTQKLTSNGWDYLMYAFRNNKYLGLNLGQKDFELLIDKSDLSLVSEDEISALMIALNYNEKEKLYLDSNNWWLLIEGSDLSVVDENNNNILMQTIINDKIEKINLNNKQWSFLIENSNTHEINSGGCDALMLALLCNEEYGFNLSSDNWYLLIENSNLKNKNKDAWDALLILLQGNNKINFNNDCWEKLLKNSSNTNKTITDDNALILYMLSNFNLHTDIIDIIFDENNLKQVNSIGLSPLLCAIIKDKNLSDEQWITLFQKCNIEEFFLKDGKRLEEYEEVWVNVFNIEQPDNHFIEKKVKQKIEIFLNKLNEVVYQKIKDTSNYQFLCDKLNYVNNSDKKDEKIEEIVKIKKLKNFL